MSTDKSPTASSPDLKTGNNLANLSSEQRLEIQETLRTDGGKGLDQSLQKKIKEVGKEKPTHGGIKTIDPTLAKRRGQS
jgi:hypothetical protein